MSGTPPRRPALRQPPALAQQLHDGVLQTLAMARVRLGRALAQDGPLPRDLGAELTVLLEREIADLRRLIAGAADPPGRPPQPDLPSALAATAAELRSATGIPLRVESRTAPRGRWSGADLVAYRIVREALHNTAKHSGATHGWVSVTASRDRLVCVVFDDGRGFPPPRTPGAAQPASHAAHFGLAAMHAQARAAGGRLDVRSSRSGTVVTLTLPANSEPAGAWPDGGPEPASPVPASPRPASARPGGPEPAGSVPVAEDGR